MLIVKPSLMRKWDKRAIEEYHISGMVLMENAAVAASDAIIDKDLLKSGDMAVIFTGGGNNGGDGYAIARQLVLKGYNVQITAVTDPEKLSGDAYENYISVKKLDLKIHLVNENTNFENMDFHTTNLIIDAVFGTGLDREITGLYKKAIKSINKAAIPIVSIDIPSGINALTGEVMGCAVKADMTISLCELKPGHLLYPGRDYCGKTVNVDISIPHSYESGVWQTMDINDAVKLVPDRDNNAYKGSFGSLAVVAGSRGMTGAAYLTSMASLRSGCGLATLAIPDSLNDIMEVKLTEVMTLPLDDNGSGHFAENSAAGIDKLLKSSSAAAIGPGLSRGYDVFCFVRNILSICKLPIVIDADALYHIAEDISILKNYQGTAVVTPHLGEMSRLTKKSISDIARNPVESADAFAKETGAVCLLKGGCTVVASPDGRIYLNAAGNAGMATGGSGDVLTGIIGGLLSQGMDSFDATCLGAFIHGTAGDLAADDKGRIGMTAGDILESLPYAWRLLLP